MKKPDHRRAWPIFAAFALLPLLYVLAYGAYASAVANSEKLPDWAFRLLAQIDPVFEPVTWVYANWPAARPLIDWYGELWP